MSNTKRNKRYLHFLALLSAIYYLTLCYICGCYVYTVLQLHRSLLSHKRRIYRVERESAIKDGVWVYIQCTVYCTCAVYIYLATPSFYAFSKAFQVNLSHYFLSCYLNLSTMHQMFKYRSKASIFNFSANTLRSETCVFT